jgi:hypothetical protein
MARIITSFDRSTRSIDGSGPEVALLMTTDLDRIGTIQVGARVPRWDRTIFSIAEA